MKKHDWRFKLVDGLDETVNLAMLAFFFALFLLAIYVQWDAHIADENASSSAFATYKPVDAEHCSFEELRAKNPEVFGWLTLDDTTVDYPIVQGPDNEKYVNTDVYGNFSLTGAIFLDSRNASAPENGVPLANAVSILYGHHMEGPIMFGVIDRYETTSFFDTHRTGTLYYGGLDHPLNIFAFVRTDGYDTGMYAPETPLSEKAMYIANLRNRATIFRDDFDPGSPLLLLSTCESGTTNGRMVLVASIGEGVPPDGTTVEIRSFWDLHKWQLFALLALLLFLLLWLLLRRRRRKERDDKLEKGGEST